MSGGLERLCVTGDQRIARGGEYRGRQMTLKSNSPDSKPQESRVILLSQC